MKKQKRKLSPKGAKKPLKERRANPAEHRERFEQLLDDAILGVKKRG